MLLRRDLKNNVVQKCIIQNTINSTIQLKVLFQFFVQLLNFIK